MANEVSNCLEIRGPAGDISAMVEQLTRPTSAVPTAMSFRNIAFPESGEWNYDWAMENWGCGADAQEVQFQAKSAELATFWFITPWTPPVEALATLSEQYPRLLLVLDWEEQQDGWGGVLHFAGGTVIEVLSYDCPESHADAVLYTRSGCACENSEEPEMAAFADCPGADPDDWDEDWTDEPRCDHCGAVQEMTGLLEWDGDTGCHVVCETAARRTAEDPDAFEQELNRMQCSSDPLEVITARLQTQAGYAAYLLLKSRPEPTIST